MQPQPKKATVTGLGPKLTVTIPAPTGTAPLITTGILNLATLSTTPVKVVGAASVPAGRVRKVRITIISSVNAAYTVVDKGATAPTITADGAGAATEGILLPSGGGIIEMLDIADTLDLYLVAQSAATIVQIAVVEQ